MEQRQIDTIGEQPLLDEARRGDASAHDRLWRLHGAEAWRFAYALAGDAEVAAEGVIAGWASLVAHPRQLATTVPVGAQVLAAVHQALPADPAWPAPPAAALVATAFAGLTPRRRGALWLRDVEALPAAEAAVALGIRAAEVDALADRARGELADRVLAAYAAGGPPARCLPAVEQLPAYAAGTLAPRREAKVRRHLDTCTGCEALLTSLDDLTPTLRGLVPALPATLADDAHDRWAASLVRLTGPLHLVLPGGRTMAPWAERTLAGAAAAIVALGITAAALMAGRGGKGGTDRLAKPASADLSIDAPDGESALGGDGTGALDGTGSSGTGGTGPAPSAPSAGAAETSRASSGSTAPTSAPTSGSTSGSSSGSAGSGSSTAPIPPPTTTVPPPPPPPPAPEPALEVTVGIGDVATVVVGDECTGVNVLGTSLGCPPPEGDDPVVLDLGGSLLGGLGG